MTIKEKAEKLEELCKSSTGCAGCILEGVRGCYFAPDDEYGAECVEESYKIAFGEFGKEKVNHPEHYQGKNECIDVMLAMFGKEAVKHFCMCNAYKYRFRADRKNGDEDIKKAEWYETKLIELGGCDE